MSPPTKPRTGSSDWAATGDTKGPAATAVEIRIEIRIGKMRICALTSVRCGVRGRPEALTYRLSYV